MNCRKKDARARAAEALCAVAPEKGGKAAEVLAQALGEHRSDIEHLRLIRCIGSLGRNGKNAIPALINEIQSGSFQRRRAAVKSIGAIGAAARDAADILETEKGRVSNLLLRGVFSKALKDIGHD